MKKLGFTLISILFASFTFAQGSIVSFTINPPAPTTTDNVDVYVNVLFSTMSCNLSNQGHSTTGSSTTAYAMHCLGMLSAMCTAIDTFHLGMLPAGTNSFSMTLTSGMGGPPCSPGIVPDDNANTTFMVTPATGIIGLNNSKTCVIYPNPMQTNGIVKIDQQIKLTNTQFQITDIAGRIVKTMNDIQTNEFTFERTGLLDGIYFYSLSQEKELISYGKIIVQ